jgi:hypothetical protein
VSKIVEILAIKNEDNKGFILEERLSDPANIIVIYFSLISYNAISNDNNNDNKDNNNNSTINLSTNKIE